MPLHDDELTIEPATVRALVDRTLPDAGALPLRRLAASGSSNALFRLGDELLVRLPRQPGGSATITKEARWLPLVGPRVPVAVPEVVVVGEPGFGYPEQWSVVRWLEGATPTAAASGVAGAALAADLVAVLTRLQSIEVPPEALVDPELRWYRGTPLTSQDEDTRLSLDACRGIAGLDLDLAAAEAVWDEAMSLPGVAEPVPPRWHHADLVAENLLVRADRLVAVLDFGGLSIGDPTVDLTVAWELLAAEARDGFRRAVGADDATWLRGRAWALSLALRTFPYYWATMPDRCARRVAVVRAVLADAAA